MTGTVVITTFNCEVVLDSYAFYARCTKCPYVSEYTPAKHIARKWANDHDEDRPAHQPRERQIWTYFGIDVFPSTSDEIIRSGMGLRWYARTPDNWREAPPILRSTTKDGMRELIREYRPR